MQNDLTLRVTRKGASSGDERLVVAHWWVKLLRRPELGALSGTILVLIFFAAVAGRSGLFSPPGIVNFLEVSAELGILASAVALLMIAGEFDLSVGSMIGFAGVVIGMLVSEAGWPIPLAVLAAFAIAICVGWANGWLVIKTGLPSFIVTLASMFILRGLTLALTRLVTNRTQIPYITNDHENDFIVQLFSGHLGNGIFVWMAHNGIIAQRSDGAPFVDGIPVAIFWWLGLAAVATWILVRTRFGNWIFASGGDANAARNVGVPVARVKISLFIMTAVVSTIFACVQVFSTGSADTLRGTQKEFEAIIAAVIGGNLLSGGYGSAIGAVFGALIFGMVEIGIFYTGVDTDWFKVFLGVMVLLAVLFNDFIRRRATEARK
jgi:simple sugar transport system permease protein